MRQPTSNSVYVVLDGVAVEGGQVSRRVLEYLRVVDQAYVVRGCVEPVWDLSIGDQVHSTDPGGVLLN